MNDLRNLVPHPLHHPLTQSACYAARSDSLVLHDDQTRSQRHNANACLDKLYMLIRNTADKLIPGETSLEQKHRIQQL